MPPTGRIAQKPRPNPPLYRLGSGPRSGLAVRDPSQATPENPNRELETAMHIRLSTHSIALALCLTLCAGPEALAAGKRPKNERSHIEVANLNILHGFACDPPVPGDGDQCRVGDRLYLLIQHIAAAGCPDLVTLQENVTAEFVPRTETELVGPLDDTVALIKERLPALEHACSFAYHLIFDRAAARPPAQGRGTDEELILSRYPVRVQEVRPLYNPLVPFFFRHVLYARIHHPRGPVDVFTTHLGSSSDLASLPCGVNVLPPPLASPTCPAECLAFVDTVRECQARQVALFVEERHDVPEPAILSGDLNAEPDSNEYAEFAGRGWIDSHLAAGNAECDPVTGQNCTSGRTDDNLSDLESTALGVDERIDFIFVVPAGEGSHCAGWVRVADHPRRPVTTTGIFAGQPNPFEPCGAAPLPICFVSDHSGNQLNLGCGRRRRAHEPALPMGNTDRKWGWRPRQ
jgi:endonuclease/exonuclease/phosphatase family metal-dependent hydrolase